VTLPAGSCVYSPSDFYITTNALTSQLDWDYFIAKTQQYMPDADVQFIDVTDDLGALCFQGPLTRALIQPHTSTSMSMEDFPAYTSQMMTIAGVEDCVVLGLSYAGTAAGVEIHCPTEGAAQIYDAIMPGQMNLGFRAMNTLRSEAEFHLMMHDYPMDFPAFGVTPQFRTKHKSDADFIGKEALKRQVKEGIRTDLMYWTLDDQFTMFESGNGKQPIYADGEEVGYVTTGQYGYTLGRGVVIGICDRASAGVSKKSGWKSKGLWEVEVAPGVRKTMQRTSPAR